MDRGRSGDTGFYDMWGFTRSILDEIRQNFLTFLEKGLKENPMKCEYFLPSVVSNLLIVERATVQVLESEDKWYGVTYKEDKPVVVEAIQAFKDEESIRRNYGGKTKDGKSV